MNPDLLWLQDRVGKLKKLLDDPQTGEISWCVHYGDLMTAISRFWNSKTVEQRKEVVENE